MTNAATVSVRLIRSAQAAEGEAAWPSVPHSRLLEALMAPGGGNTRGGVPLWADYRQGRRCFDIQYGAPAGALDGPARLWQLVGGESDAMWVRSGASGAPVDAVAHTTAELAGPPRVCRYGFDEVRIRWAPGSQLPPLPPLPVTTDGGTWHLRARGSYLTCNDRSAPTEPVLGLPSPTTWVHRGCPLERVLPAGLAALAPALQAGAARVDYFFHGRLVHRSVREASVQPGEDVRWREYSLDDWDNCLDRALLRLLGRPPLTDDVYEADERAFGGQRAWPAGLRPAEERRRPAGNDPARRTACSAHAGAEPNAAASLGSERQKSRGGGRETCYSAPTTMAHAFRPTRPPSGPLGPASRLPTPLPRPAAEGEVPWSPTSWRGRPSAQDVAYEDGRALERAVDQLRALPPLVTSWEVERLRLHLAEAQRGERFVLQGGDCAEMLADCRPEIIANKLKILLQMSLVLVQGSLKPVVRIGRLAGQYAKPRSKAVETRDGDGGLPVTLPSYFGDLVNRAEFSADARRTDPQLLLAGYQHAALTLNFIRSLSEGGFADLHHPEQWDLSFFERADLSEEARAQYERASRRLVEALRFMEALGETSIAELTRVEFFTSHEGLNLHYESAQTRTVPRRPGWYDLTTHMPWIGERTRQLDGAHVEFFRGIANPVGVKIGPATSPDDLLRLLDRLNPGGDEGKIVLIARMGAARVGEALPALAEAVRREGRPVLWMSDPMHGNTQTTSTGIKTRNFDDILREIEISFDVHEAAGGRLGGVHFELTGEDVTECIGGGLSEDDLDRNYATECDPRLNYRQALEMAFRIAHRMAGAPPPSVGPPRR